MSGCGAGWKPQPERAGAGVEAETNASAKWELRAGSRELGAGSWELGAGSREQGAGSREQGVGTRAVKKIARRAGDANYQFQRICGIVM